LPVPRICRQGIRVPVSQSFVEDQRPHRRFSYDEHKKAQGVELNGLEFLKTATTTVFFARSP
jgi:hypothetical protein